MEAIFLLFSSLHSGASYIPFQWNCGILACLVWLGALMVIRTRSVLLGACMLYFLSNALLTFGWPLERHAELVVYLNRVGVPARDIIVNLHASSMYSFIGAAMAIVVVSSLEACQIRRFFRVLGPLTLLNALWVIGSAAVDYTVRGNNGHSGFIDYSSINGSIIACGLCSVEHTFKDMRVKILAVLVCVAAIFLSASSIPIGVLLVVLLARGMKADIKLAGAILAFSVAVFVTANAFIPDLVNMADRDVIYMTFLSWWEQFDTPLAIGMGPGSLEELNKIIQLMSGYQMNAEVNYFAMALHSDWLQVLFEYGVIGLALIILLYLQLLLKSWERCDPQIWVWVCGLGAAAVFNYPFRYFSVVFVGLLCLIGAYRLHPERPLSEDIEH